MVGRFAGSFLMRSIAAETVLACFSIGAFIVMIVTVFSTGPVAMWSLILVGLFHSIMFPTIFTLGIKGLGPLTEEGAGLLIMAIAGGALVVVQGWLAELVPAHRGLRALRALLRAMGRADLGSQFDPEHAVIVCALPVYSMRCERPGN